MTSNCKIGIIGGSGLDDPNLLTNFTEQDVFTPYGNPSSKITQGKISGVEVCILARHGKKHEIPPSQVNYQANISALDRLGCNYILATTAVGSLRAYIHPENLVFPNQFIDFTKQRLSTFFNLEGKVVHTPMSEPFSKELRDILSEACEELGFKYNREIKSKDISEDLTLITIEGPRFSTRAESNMFRGFGADIINMSTCPEVILANEKGIPYQTIAMSTDYDCWKENEEPVTWEMIKTRMDKNANRVKELLVRTIEKLSLK